MKIRTRLCLALVALVAIGFYGLVDWIIDDLQPRYLEAMEESMIDTATLLASHLEQQVTEQTIEVDDLRATLTTAQRKRFAAGVYQLTKRKIDVRVYVTDSTGRVVFDSADGRDEGKDYSRWNNVIRTLRGEYGARTTRRDKTDATTAALHVSSPIMIEEEIAGTLTVCKPVDSAMLFLKQARSKVMRAGMIAALAVLLVGIIISSWITRPIQKLTQYANAVRDGRRPPLPLLGRNEIGRLGAAFEEMRDTLEGKQYVENYVQTLTHEMKSPLSAIDGAAELLAEEMSPAQRAKFLLNIRTESGRIQGLVERMLQLSSLEKRKGLLDTENVDVARLLHEVLTDLKPVLATKRLVPRTTSQGSGTVRGETFLIRQALSNLIQNAVDFSPTDATLDIAITHANDAVVVTISDGGPGVPDYARDKVFDRFYSLRRPDTGNRSSGLGLTFVREVAALHAGTVTLENAPGGGARARLTLPTVPPPA